MFIWFHIRSCDFRSEQKMKDVEGIESEQVMVLERLKQNQRQDYLKVKGQVMV